MAKPQNTDERSLDGELAELANDAPANAAPAGRRRRRLAPWFAVLLLAAFVLSGLITYLAVRH
jgi:hypothetical protein